MFWDLARSMPDGGFLDSGEGQRRSQSCVLLALGPPVRTRPYPAGAFQIVRGGAPLPFQLPSAILDDVCLPAPSIFHGHTPLGCAFCSSCFCHSFIFV